MDRPIKTLRLLAALAVLFFAFSHGARAQGVTRVCQNAINATTGANNCVDVSQSFPLSVAPGTTGNIATGQVTVGATATLIAAARPGRVSITIINNGTTDVFLGPSGVTATTGLLLLGIKGTAITISGSAAIYGIVGSGTQIVCFMEQY